MHARQVVAGNAEAPVARKPQGQEDRIVEPAQRLQRHVAADEAEGADFYVIPEPRDAAHPERWVEDALFLPDTRAAYRRIVNQGWTDAIRIRTPNAERGPFTFWDYQRQGWERDNGIRIDHLLLSPQAADLLVETGIDKEARAAEKPSDHVPIWIELDA